MKNLFLLPTDKPSRLGLCNNQLVFLQKHQNILVGHKDYPTTNQHIYITSDEEITVGYYLDLADNSIIKVTLKDLIKFKSYDNLQFKKIILTTDQDLINLGVQSIDEEFLEWFVAHPSCESVEVQMSHIDETAYKYGIITYEIIIPKEEPKQETLEEAAESLYPFAFGGIGNAENDKKNHFIDGAKWQQERMYSEEDLISFAHFYFQEEFNSTMQTSKSTDEILQEWKQFKKK